MYKKAFIALHGIGIGKVDYILASLKQTGNAPRAERTKHRNNAHGHLDQTKEFVCDHIKNLITIESY